MLHNLIYKLCIGIFFAVNYKDRIYILYHIEYITLTGVIDFSFIKYILIICAMVGPVRWEGSAVFSA